MKRNWMMIGTVVLALAVALAAVGGCTAQKAVDMVTQKTSEAKARFESEDTDAVGVLLIKPSLIWGTGLHNESFGLLIIQSKGKGSIGGRADTQVDRAEASTTTVDTRSSPPTSQPSGGPEGNGDPLGEAKTE